jgi:large subunit ribosomal protein L11
MKRLFRIESIIGKKRKVRKSTRTILVRVVLPSGLAKKEPPLGPTLGQYGVKAEEFADKFNKDTKVLEEGVMIPVVILIAPSKTFTYETRSPTVSYLLDRGFEAEILGRDTYLFKVSKKQLLMAAYNTVLIKTNGVEHEELCKSMVKQILGTARSMQIACFHRRKKPIHIEREERVFSKYNFYNEENGYDSSTP